MSEDDPTCGECKGPMHWEECWTGCNDGGYHDCGDDSCCCLEPEDDMVCDECHGNGGYWVCSTPDNHPPIGVPQ